jgi:hypothetical protein
MAGIKRASGVEYPVLTPNLKGYEAALKVHQGVHLHCRMASMLTQVPLSESTNGMIHGSIKTAFELMPASQQGLVMWQSAGHPPCTAGSHAQQD